MRRSPAAAAPATPPSNKTQFTGSCVPARGRGPELAQDRCDAPHGRLRAPPGPRPRPRPPRSRSPSRHVPCQQQQARGNEDILLSATCPSTTRCSKDVTTHQHGPGARPGRPCPVPACSGQPLPGERRFSSALGNRVFRSLSLSDDRPFIVLLLVTSCKPLIRVRGKSSPCRLLLCEVCVGKQTGV